MSSVQDFYDKLSDVQKDIFLQMATDMQSSAPEEKLARLRSFHSKLKSEIDAINRRREGLGGMLNNVESLLKLLLDYTRKNGTSLELTLFRGSLEKLAQDLKAEVAATKPEKKLEKKFDVARRIEALMQRQDLSVQLFSSLLKKGDVRELLNTGENKKAVPVASGADLIESDDLDEDENEG